MAALAGLPPPRRSAEFWRALQQFTLNNAHYYCETADISRPFPRWVLGGCRQGGWELQQLRGRLQGGRHVLRAGSTPAPVDPLACLLQEAQRRHFELVTWSTECL